MTSPTAESKMDFGSDTEGMWAYPPNDVNDDLVFETKYRKIAPVLRYSQIVGEVVASSVICLPPKEQEQEHEDETLSIPAHKTLKGGEASASLEKIWGSTHKIGLNPKRNLRSVMEDLKLLYEGDSNADFLSKLNLRSLEVHEFVVTDKDMFLDPEEEENKKKKSMKMAGRQQNPVREGIQAGQGWDTKMATEKQATHRASHRIKIAPPAIQIPGYMDSGLSSATMSDMSLGLCCSCLCHGLQTTDEKRADDFTVSTRSNQTPSKESIINTSIYLRSSSPSRIRQNPPIALMTPSRSRSATRFHPQSVETYSSSSNGQVSPTGIRVRIPKITPTTDYTSDHSSHSSEYARIDQFSQDLSMLNLLSRKNTADTRSQASESSTLSRRSEQRLYDLESPTKRRDRVLNFMENYNRGYAVRQGRSNDHQSQTYQKVQLQLIGHDFQPRTFANPPSRSEGLSGEHRFIQVPVIPISAQTTPHLPMFQGQGQKPRA